MNKKLQNFVSSKVDEKLVECFGWDYEKLIEFIVEEFLPLLCKRNDIGEPGCIPEDVCEMFCESEAMSGCEYFCRINAALIPLLESLEELKTMWNCEG